LVIWKRSETGAKAPSSLPIAPVSDSGLQLVGLNVKPGRSIDYRAPVCRRG
jgi:hypothetical protein